MLRFNTKPIEEYCKKNNMTVAEFCKNCKISVRTYKKLAQIDVSAARSRTFIKMALFSHISLDDLIVEE